MCVYPDLSYEVLINETDALAILLPNIFAFCTTEWISSLQEQISFQSVHPIITPGVPKYPNLEMSIFMGRPQLPKLIYGPLARSPLPFPPILHSICTTLQALPWDEILGFMPAQRLNCVLVNRYWDGHDSMGWHDDADIVMGPQPFIASLSLGQTRQFAFKHSTTRRTITCSLSSGAERAYGRLQFATGVEIQSTEAARFRRDSLEPFFPLSHNSRVVNRMKAYKKANPALTLHYLYKIFLA